MEKNSKFKEIAESIAIENSKTAISSLTDSAKAYLVYALATSNKKKSLIVCTNVAQANRFIQDIKLYSDIEVLYYPNKSLIYYDVEAESKEVENQRIYVTERILKGDKNIVVTTIDALLVNMKPHIMYKNENIILKKGQSISIENLKLELVNLGYERTEVVEGKGQFASRGGIIDMFCINSNLPYRIEFFGDEIDSIRTFDVITQRSIDTIKEIELSYVSETNLSDKNVNDLTFKLKNILENEKLSEDLKISINEDIEKLNNSTLSNVFDKYFTLLVDKSETFLDYVKDYDIYINEREKCITKVENICYENNEVINSLEKRGIISSKFVNKYLDYDYVKTKLKDYSTIYLENIKSSESDFKMQKEFKIESQEFNFYKSRMEVLLSDLKLLKDNKKILVFYTDTRIEQVKNYLIDNKIKVKKLDECENNEELKLDTVYIVKGILSSGFYIKDLNILLIAEPVSGVSLDKAKKTKNSLEGLAINSYDDLEIGDYLVHENHGIGVYIGIENIDIQSVLKDYIKIEYADKGMLYVPINQLDLVRKYICDDDSRPKVNSLGTKEWQKTKTAVNEHVKEVAKELIKLYAKRENCRGFAFPKDTPWQKEFEDAFPYELTDDQKIAVDETKEDMENEKPMDRLLLGDVGYGKTEVALRAAFKAVMSGKQVAYLVPTTVLSLQQYNTFKSRMENFSIKVEMLSRFKSKKEQTEILKELIDGKVDIVIGTHRLLSKDVFFKDLGLLVIDEEHRFGVKAKETIKALKENIDVLSMTATPIPRTLHMSMIGVRSMSTLSEPPMERLPVHTYVMDYNESTIKEAIEKELLRDGQVFYINNRVNNIEEVSIKVQNMVPEARVAFAHGQMNPEEIERIMLKFMNHKLDVIVCTTILESGIDIQNANTLIIEDADRLGLAQLYQIRGRVGRSNRLAYAYITYKKNKQISEVAEKRLKAIRDFTEFGSGFKIALRDLEIRGAGNLLGREQHGHMAKVGYELYLALLEKAIKEEKNENVNELEEITKEVKIDLEVSAYISDKYIKDPIQKIIMYQKISNIKTQEEVMDVIDELLDRYGDLPRETENLIKIVEIRNAARKIGITKILGTKDYIKFEPGNYKFTLTNTRPNDILIRVQSEISKLKNILNEEG